MLSSSKEFSSPPESPVAPSRHWQLQGFAAKTTPSYKTFVSFCQTATATDDDDEEVEDDDEEEEDDEDKNDDATDARSQGWSNRFL